MAYSRSIVAETVHKVVDSIESERFKMLPVPVWTSAIGDPKVQSSSDILTIRTVGDVCRKALALILATGNHWSIAVRDRNLASLEHYASFAQIQHTNDFGSSCRCSG